MAVVTQQRVLDYTCFHEQPFGTFNGELSPQERKVVLRDAPLDAFRAMIEVMKPLSGDESADIGRAAAEATVQASHLVSILCEKPGPDRLFRDPAVARMIRFNTGGPIPKSADDTLADLSSNLVKLVRYGVRTQLEGAYA